MIGKDRVVCGCIVVLFAAALVNVVAAQAASPLWVVLDGTGTGRVFDGIGAGSGGGASSRLLVNYPEPERSQILDYLFKPHYGASLQMLKVEIGSDGNSGMGSEASHMRDPQHSRFDRGYEWWIMNEAKRRDPAIKLVALAWNFPAWVGKPNSQATADYLVAFLTGARQVYGLNIDYIGIWNETRMDPRFIVTLRRTLDAHHLSTQIIADDLVNTWAIVGSMAADPQVRDAVDVIATHYPRTVSPKEVQERSAEWHKPLWSSEDGPWGDEWGTFGLQSTPLAELLNRNYIKARITSTNVWNMVTSYYDILDYTNAGLMRAKTPWSGHYEVTSPLWVVAHTTQFAQPGWRYIDGASALLPEGGSYVTLHHGTDYSIIVETLSAKRSQAVEFGLRGGLSTGTVHVWRSTAEDFFREVGRLRPKDGKFKVAFEPRAVYSLTTTTGQAKGDAVPPPDSPFPVPYRDDFESYRLGEGEPRYLAEQNGAFEVSKCPGARSGQCLQQVIEQPPIWWTYGADAVRLGTPAVIGDPRWRDYRVSADVFIEHPGYASVLGRVSRVSCCDGALSGYQLRLYDSGKWELLAESKDAVLATGQVTPGLRVWRHEELAFRSDRISGSIDGKQVVSLTDTRHAAGLAGIANGWNTGSYDNLAIDPIAPGVPVISAPPPLTGVPPESPQFFVPAPSSHTIGLSWSPVAGATSYRIRIGRREGQFVKTQDVGDVTSYKVTTLTNDAKYYFQVIAVRGKLESKPSDTLTATPTDRE